MDEEGGEDLDEAGGTFMDVANDNGPGKKEILKSIEIGQNSRFSTPRCFLDLHSGSVLWSFIR